MSEEASKGRNPWAHKSDLGQKMNSGLRYFFGRHYITQEQILVLHINITCFLNSTIKISLKHLFNY